MNLNLRSRRPDIGRWDYLFSTEIRGSKGRGGDAKRRGKDTELGGLTEMENKEVRVLERREVRAGKAAKYGWTRTLKYVWNPEVEGPSGCYFAGGSFGPARRRFCCFRRSCSRC